MTPTGAAPPEGECSSRLDALCQSGCGNCLKDMGRLPEAVAEYQRAVARSPSDPTFAFNLAQAPRPADLILEAVTPRRSSGGTVSSRAASILLSVHCLEIVPVAPENMGETEHRAARPLGKSTSHRALIRCTERSAAAAGVRVRAGLRDGGAAAGRLRGGAAGGGVDDGEPLRRGAAAPQARLRRRAWPPPPRRTPPRPHPRLP
jgi:hypothetical protein